MMYNWQQKDWPDFQYDLSEIEPLLFRFSEKVGRVSGLLRGLPEKTQNEAIIDLMVAEAIKTSEIEGEYLSRQDVMSSIRNNLGLGQQRVSDLRAQGAAELMVDVRNTYEEELTLEKLFSWHQMIMIYCHYPNFKSHCYKRFTGFGRKEDFSSFWRWSKHKICA